MHKYPSDIDRSQFAIIAPILESSRKTTSPRTVDLYDVFCGILYVLKSGCQWRIDAKRLSKLEKSTFGPIIFLYVQLDLVYWKTSCAKWLKHASKWLTALP